MFVSKDVFELNQPSLVACTGGGEIWGDQKWLWYADFKLVVYPLVQLDTLVITERILFFFKSNQFTCLFWNRCQRCCLKYSQYFEYSMAFPLLPVQLWAMMPSAENKNSCFILCLLLRKKNPVWWDKMQKQFDLNMSCIW